MTDPAAAPTDAVRQALAALELAAVRHRREVRRRLRIGDEELSALLHLSHHGGVAQGRLAEVTTLSRSGAGAMIQRLEHDGFVQRRTDPGDRRLRRVELSPAGRERMAQAYGELDHAAQTLLADRPAAELDALARLLDGLADAARAAGGEDGAIASAAQSGSGDPIWRRWG
jgi:DNA-binding MarR family transcriptional regulator